MGEGQQGKGPGYLGSQTGKEPSWQGGFTKFFLPYDFLPYELLIYVP